MRPTDRAEIVVRTWVIPTIAAVRQQLIEEIRTRLR
jgi:hypothetical protein